MKWDNLSFQQKTSALKLGIKLAPASMSQNACFLINQLAILALILYSFAAPAYSSGTNYACADSSISIRAVESVNHHAICNSATDALAFFDRLGIKLTGQLGIDVVQNLPDGMSDTAVGCYDKEVQKVFVLTFAEFEKRQIRFDFPANQSMYRSLVTHEVAHAVANCSFKIPEPTYHAEEYVAYVAMFTMMDPALRAQLLEETSAVGFDGEYYFNEITYSLDPMRFGIEAYLHYLKKEHGDVFLLKILAGNALTNSAHELP